MRPFMTPFFTLILIGGFLLMGYMHEQVHVAIFASYGIDSEVYYFKYFPDFVTVGEDACPTEECTLAHNIAEAVVYPLTGLYVMIGFGLLFLIALLEDPIPIAKPNTNPP